MNIEQIAVLLFIVFVIAVTIDGFVREWIAEERMKRSDKGDSTWTFAERT